MVRWSDQLTISERAVAFSFTKIERTTVSEQIIEQIKKEILSGGFKDGDKLPSERALAETFQVSRPALREALRALEYVGIIETQPGGGAFVRKDADVLNSHLQFAQLLRRYSLEEMLETRRVVESATIRLAIARGTPEDIAALRTLYESSLKCTGDPEAFLEADFRFHEAIAEMAGNAILLEILTAMRRMTLELNAEVVGWPGQVAVAADFHAQILDAMAARDADAAHAAINAHLDDILDTIHHVFASQSDSATNGI